MIADASLLPELMRQARAAGRLALDTEFMGEGRYRTLLCLVQLAVPEDGARGASAGDTPGDQPAADASS